MESVARAYDIRWLVLEKDDSVPAAKAILVDGQRPSGVGRPVLVRDDAALYPVCTMADDPRCASSGMTKAVP